MASQTNSRINSIDLLKGLVMVVMALDHTREYFHYSAFIFDPADPTQSTLPIFFTRFITHFCAPAFSFLAGTSAYMAGKRKTPKELSGFLVKRGLWLVFIELTIVNFGWYFDIQFKSLGFQVIWALGISMIILAALVHLPKSAILLFSCGLILGHNLLDDLHFSESFFWAVLHRPAIFVISGNFRILVEYPIIPWIAVMAMGYYFGSFYDKTFDIEHRKKTFNVIGFIAILLFVVLRATNRYGDPNVFKQYGSISQDLISFFNPTKYPPSLLYLLLTLGAAFLFLANSERLKGRVVNFFCTFGRVPFFYYILHLYLIHFAAMVFAELSGWGGQSMILNGWATELTHLKGYGLPLFGVYVVWIVIIGLLYPLCKWFDKYKKAHREQWWVSYL